jgi:hypothetical protein
VQSQDEDIRALERAVSATPTDGQARVRLAHALGRKGRRDDAIKSLGLASFPDAGFLEARALADEFWAVELSALELATMITLPAREFLLPGPVVDRTGRFVAFTAWREADTSVFHLHDTLTGKDVSVPWSWRGGRPSSPPSCLSDHRGPVFAFTDRAFYASNWVGTILEVDLGDANLEAVKTPLPEVGIDSLSPEGDLFFARGRLPHDRGSQSGIYEWPSGRAVITRECVPGWGFDAVSWSERSLITSMPAGNDGLQIFQLTGFDGLERALLGPNHALESLGAGLLIARRQELAVHDLRSDKEIEVVPRSSLRGLPNEVRWASLSSDERTLGLSFRDEPRCLTLDRTKGCLVGDEDVRSWFMKPEDNQTPGGWHPHTAALFVRAEGGREALVQLPGKRLLELPTEGRAGQWSGDGHTLLVDSVRSPGRLEVWRTPTGRARLSR